MMDQAGLESVLTRMTGQPRVVCGGSGSTPVPLLTVVDRCLKKWRLACINAPIGVPTRKGIVHETVFIGPGSRHADTLEYVPCRLSLAPRLYEDRLAPDILILHTSAPRNGTVSMGIEVQVLPAALESAKRRGALIIAQVNPNMPYVFGDGIVDVDDIDIGVSVDAPLPTAAMPPAGPAAQQIGELVASRVPAGATLQVGIGAVPDAVVAMLPGDRTYGVWTELLTDSVRLLEQTHRLDERPVTGTFAMGTPALYQWLDDNPRVQLLRCEKTNNPNSIAAQPRMASVNTALQVDLFGQVNATRVRGKIHSGIGGSTDFLVGAMHSPGGQALIAMLSWHPKADCSTIVGLLDSPASASQPSAVVTEQGVADLFGRSQEEQARHLIDDAAHPDARHDLWRRAAELSLA
ncbi:acetyl-CoA hydrolase [Cutibacterium sp. WCA-380-WT-3A]|uniref:Acetyl-CoA hydrolase n=1 Tax=Cutibacterium porci TaxID=2605781 RepID=A0A7K0J688_9ACTN|nr:acetyl-CoA hydrolase/transferase C-terminal domain-containing protein [Cutibacterium porci]MSS45444.1 acetyl-CoA hydrolase [Cutibacterium porci]